MLVDFGTWLVNEMDKDWFKKLHADTRHHSSFIYLLLIISEAVLKSIAPWASIFCIVYAYYRVIEVLDEMANAIELRSAEDERKREECAVCNQSRDGGLQVGRVSQSEGSTFTN